MTVVDGRIVGCALSIIVDYDTVKGDHTYAKVTGGETFDTHTPNGNILYGIEVFIHPDYRGLRLARRMYDYRKELCEKLNLKAIMFGGRIPNYHKYADRMRPKEYIDKVRQREIVDPVLLFQLSNDFHVRKVMRNYLPNDEESLHYACLLQWDNIYYQAPTEEYIPPKTTVRVGIVQWQMRSYKTLDDLFEQVEFFVDSVSGYQSDFVFFPNISMPRLWHGSTIWARESIRGLAQYTDEIRERFIALAIKYNINIITGSMPQIKEDGQLYNVGFLCRRDGTYEMYEKLHVTPDEMKCWGLSGGKTIRTFETDCAKVGVLICYDVEFPELSRIMASEGMQILFVPFLTDTQNAYSRVQVCAHARAIENECFVVIAGSVGNLPKVHNMDIQYARSGVYHPLRLRFSYGRTASRSDAQYGNDPYFGCQPEPVERAAHLRQRPESQRPSQRLIRGADEKIDGHATFLDGRKSCRSAESRCRPGRDSSPQCRNRVRIPETPCRIDRTRAFGIEIFGSAPEMRFGPNRSAGPCCSSAADGTVRTAPTRIPDRDVPQTDNQLSIIGTNTESA